MSAERRIDAVAWLVLAAWGGVAALALASLTHNVDEGANIYAARLVQQGQAPFRDFFYHQPPLYVFSLALLPTSHFVYGRLLSLLAAVVVGRLLFRLAGRIFGATSWLPLLVLALYCAAGLQVFHLLALPGAPMLAFAVAGCWWLLSRPEGVGAALGAGACLALSILFKPLTLAVAVALAAALAVDPRQRRRLVPFGLSLAGVGLAGWGAFHLASDGAFTELLFVQGARYAEPSVAVRMWQSLPGLPGDMPTSPSGLTLVFYALAFRGSLDVLLVAGAVAGVWVLWRRAPAVPPGEKLFWTAWPVLALLFSFTLWGVSKEHYHVLYLPPLALLSAFGVARFAAPGGWRRGVAACACAAVMGAGVLSLSARRQDYRAALALRGESAALLAFDPTINVLSETEVACGVLLFWLPPYRPQLEGDEAAGFEHGRDRLIACLEAEPETRIVIHQLSPAFLVVDAVLHDWVLRQPPERVVYLSDAARAAFRQLY
ncbi:MAG: hypothetical protein QNK03_05905 [Myxococcota bacterium]|nr:hypothetical protein [Myxococcota bacterium]